MVALLHYTYDGSKEFVLDMTKRSGNNFDHIYRIREAKEESQAGYISVNSCR